MPDTRLGKQENVQAEGVDSARCFRRAERGIGGQRPRPAGA